MALHRDRSLSLGSFRRAADVPTAVGHCEVRWPMKVRIKAEVRSRCPLARMCTDIIDFQEEGEYNYIASVSRPQALTRLHRRNKRMMLSSIVREYISASGLRPCRQCAVSNLLTHQSFQPRDLLRGVDPACCEDWVVLKLDLENLCNLNRIIPSSWSLAAVRKESLMLRTICDC